MSAPKGTRTVRLSYLRSTKRTYLYTTPDQDALTSNLYLRKEAVGETPPPVITVTVSWGKDAK